MYVYVCLGGAIYICMMCMICRSLSLSPTLTKPLPYPQHQSPYPKTYPPNTHNIPHPYPQTPLYSIFAEELQRKTRSSAQITPDEVFDAVRSVMRRCKGGYAVCILINRVGMVGDTI